MDINSPVGQQIYKSIERGHMVPTPTGFKCKDTGWCYDLTSDDYFIRRKPETLQIERIGLGSDITVPVNALEPDEHLRVGTMATYDELLWPRTLPFNVKKNVRPGGRGGEELLKYCRDKHWDVTEHDPAKWPYFEKPWPRGSNSSMIQSPVDMEHAGWPVNKINNLQTGRIYGASMGMPAGVVPPYGASSSHQRIGHHATQEAQPAAMLQRPEDVLLAGAERREQRYAKWAAEDAQWEQDHPVANNFATALGLGVFLGGICLIGAAVGTVLRKIRHK